MKKIFIFVIAIVSFESAYANTRVIQCVSEDAVSVRLLEEQGSHLSSIEITYGESDNPPVEIYNFSKGLDNVVNGVGDTLVGTSKESVQFGGETTKAILLRVTPGKARKSVLAAGGSVFTLSSCLDPK